MAQNYFSIVTNKGRNKLALSSAGGAAVTITHFAIGDGNGNEVNPTAASTALVREVWRTPVESVVIDPLNPSAVLVTSIIPTAAGGWWMREFGIFDVDGDMIAVAKPVSQYKPTALEGQLEDIRYEFQIIIGETANVTMLVDPSVLLASRAWVESRKVPVAQLSLTPWVPVKSMTVTAPPANPDTWDTYVVPAAVSGAWAGQAQKLAEWNGVSWGFIQTENGHGISLPDGRVFEKVAGTYVEKLALDVQSGKWTYAAAAGSANVLTATLAPAPSAYTNGMLVMVGITLTSTSATPTLNLNGIGARSIVNPDGSALTVGALVAGAKQLFSFDSALNKFLLMTPANTGVKMGSGWIRHSDGTYEAWGQATFNGTTTQVDVTLPITFPTSVDSVLVSDTGAGVFPGAGWPLSTSQIRCYVQVYNIDGSNGNIKAKNGQIILWYRCWGK